MSIVPMIILIIVITIAVTIYPRKDTFITKFKFKGTYKSFELEICTKQKNDPPRKSDRSNYKK